MRHALCGPIVFGSVVSLLAACGGDSPQALLDASLDGSDAGAALQAHTCLLATEEGEGIELDALPIASGTVIVVSGPGQQRDLDLSALRSLYGLTAAEARVAQLMARGRTPKMIASALEVAITTVRTHLRSVQTKLHATSQADLVRRLLSSIASCMPTTTGT